MEEKKSLIDRIEIAYEPNRNNRFIVKFPLNMEIQSWWVSNITIPKIVNNKWQNIEISLKSLIGPSTSQKIYHNLLKNKNFEITIENLDPTGVSVQKWTCFIKKVISVDFGGLSEYDNDGIQEIKVVLKTKNCILNY